MKEIINIFAYGIVGYLIGSIPWALIIGKVFYHKDIRNYGSGNLGGSNAGRVLGKKVGVAVILLDGLKAFLFMLLLTKLAPAAIPVAGMSVIVGHCFPIFAKFKGGKGVASAFGYLLGLGLFGFGDIVFTFVYPFLIFALILGLTKIVSISSMLALVAASIIAFITNDLTVAICITIITVFIIYRHHTNIARILKGQETKITWLR